MRSTATRWVVASAVGLGLIGLSFKASDLFGPDETPRPVAAKRTSPEAPQAPGAPQGARAPSAVGTAAVGNTATVAPETGPHEVAEPLDTVHALVGQPASRMRLGSAAAARRRSAIAAGPRARRRSTAVATLEGESDLPRGPQGQTGSGAILPGANPGERAPATPPPPDVDRMVFDSGDASYPTDAQVAVADLKGVHAGTVSFWLQPQWAEGSQDDAAFVELGDGLRVVKNVNFMRFEALKDGEVTSGIGAPITAWKDGEWHQVTATWQGDQLSLYLDGNLVSRQQRVPTVDLGDNAQLFVGSSYPAGRPVAPGVIGMVGLESRPLTPAEVQARFLKTVGQ
jgi:Concanavalin A-like lectin/glucanases superfamily